MDEDNQSHPNQYKELRTVITEVIEENYDLLVRLFVAGVTHQDLMSVLDVEITHQAIARRFKRDKVNLPRHKRGSLLIIPNPSTQETDFHAAYRDRRQHPSIPN